MNVFVEKNQFEEILFRSLFDATSRLRTTAFANLLLCAIVLCNIYTQWYAYDDRQLATAYEKLEERQARIKTIEDQYRCPKTGLRNANACTPGALAPFESWVPADRKEINELTLKSARLKNMLRTLDMPSVTLPLVDFRLSTNDLHPIVGGFMCIIALWALFTARQIQYIYSDTNPAIRSIITKYADALSHAFATANPHGRAHGYRMVSFVIFAPTLTLVAAIYWDSYTLVSFKKTDRDTWLDAFIQFSTSEPLNNHIPLLFTAVFALLTWAMGRNTRRNLMYVYHRDYGDESIRGKGPDNA